MDALSCPWDPATFIILSNNVPTLFYYSHGVAILASLFLSFFLFFKKRNLINSIFLFINVCFSFWVFFDLITWSSNRSDTILFFWLVIILLELLVYAGSFYFALVFFENKDLSIRSKFILLIFLLPVMFLLPTKYILTETSAMTCVPVESKFIIYYSYMFEIGILLFIIFSFIKNFRNEKDDLTRKKITWFTVGIVIFLLAFSSGNIIGSFTDDWNLAQYGLFGMPIFIGFLGYLIVKFKAFDIKLIGAQALVVAQFVLIGSMLFFSKNLTNQILTVITLVITSGAGWFLIQSVKKEVERKEQLQKISDALVIANQRLKELDLTKSEFISIASHQLRTPLTAIKGYISLLLEGSYGVVSAPVLDILNKLYSVNNRLVHLVEDLLNVSRIEAGRIQYSFAPTQIEPIIVELVDMFKPSAKEKNLTLTMKLSKVPLPLLTVDPNKIKEVVSNLIDNSIKYTVKGGTVVSLESTPVVARIIVSDTGIGIHEEDKKNLFQKFLRSKETTKMVVSGAGLGLYVGKSFIEAHGGKIWAESDGPDKGSRFIIELPLVNTKIHTGTSDQPSHSEKG